MNLIKKYWWILLLIIIILIAIPFIINESYKANKGYETLWGAKEVLAFYGSMLTFLGTCFLGALALWQNRKANETNQNLVKSQMIAQWHSNISLNKIILSEYIKASTSQHVWSYGIINGSNIYTVARKTFFFEFHLNSSPSPTYITFNSLMLIFCNNDLKEHKYALVPNKLVANTSKFTVRNSTIGGCTLNLHFAEDNNNLDIIIEQSSYIRGSLNISFVNPFGVRTSGHYEYLCHKNSTDGEIIFECSSFFTNDESFSVRMSN